MATTQIFTTPARMRECHGCGLIQLVPALTPGRVARCPRCRTVLRRTRRDSLARALALNVSALVLLVISVTMTMMTVSTFGMYHSAGLLSGPEGLRRHGLWELAVVVVFTTVAAPFLKLLCSIYVLGMLRLASPPAHVRVAFKWAQRLRPWSMIDVYLLGVFVAYVKLSDLVHIQVGIALYALCALMLVMVAADAVLDPQAVWEEMDRRGPRIGGAGHPAVSLARPPAGAVACGTCRLLSVPRAGNQARCPRCGSVLEKRKPASITRTWALIVTATMLYIPANLYPVLTVEQLGFGAPSTILGGARQLLDAGMWPLAAIVFVASIMIPCLKMVGLAVMLIATRAGSARRLRDRAVLYRIVRVIGRWSMIDIFMESILVALVQFGVIVTIDPGVGAIAFAAVVILTMFAAETFDPRLMWDAASGAPERTRRDGHPRARPGWLAAYSNHSIEAP